MFKLDFRCVLIYCWPPNSLGPLPSFFFVAQEWFSQVSNNGSFDCCCGTALCVCVVPHKSVTNCCDALKWICRGVGDTNMKHFHKIWTPRFVSAEREGDGPRLSGLPLRRWERVVVRDYTQGEHSRCFEICLSKRCLCWLLLHLLHRLSSDWFGCEEARHDVVYRGNCKEISSSPGAPHQQMLLVAEQSSRGGRRLENQDGRCEHSGQSARCFCRAFLLKGCMSVRQVTLLKWPDHCLIRTKTKCVKINSVLFCIGRKSTTTQTSSTFGSCTPTTSTRWRKTMELRPHAESWSRYVSVTGPPKSAKTVKSRQRLRENLGIVLHVGKQNALPVRDIWAVGSM